MDKVVLMQEGDTVLVIRPISNTPEEFALANPGSKVVAANSLPDREFRDAWTIDGTIDLEKAKKIWQKKIRVVRDAKLKELDIKWMQAMERGEVKIAASIAADKQVLRDLPEREELVNAKSISEIKAFWPFN
jgi:hypothetical protein